jgi:hypothetical protein
MKPTSNKETIMDLTVKILKTIGLITASIFASTAAANMLGQAMDLWGSDN